MYYVTVTMAAQQCHKRSNKDVCTAWLLRGAEWRGDSTPRETSQQRLWLSHLVPGTALVLRL